MDDEQKDERLVWLGRRVKTARTAAKLTQDQVAERMTQRGAKFHRVQLANVERGIRDLSTVEVQAIAHVLGVPVVDLVRDFGTDAVVSQRMGHQGKIVKEHLEAAAVDLSAVAYRYEGARYAHVQSERSAAAFFTQMRQDGRPGREDDPILAAYVERGRVAAEEWPETAEEYLRRERADSESA